MVCKAPVSDITREKFDAVLFDLDGVITRTAKVHAASWKRLFERLARDQEKRKDRLEREYDRVVICRGREKKIPSKDPYP